MSEGIMSKRLKECYEKHKLISIYNDIEDARHFFAGYIGAYDDADVLMQHISRDGLYDGYVVIPRDDIYQQVCDGMYEDKIETLYRTKRQKHENIEIHDNKVLQSALEFAQKKRYLIRVEVQDTTIIGFVKEYDEETICLDVITEDEVVRDGESEIKLDGVNVFRIDSEDEQAMRLIFTQNQVKE